MEATAVVVVFVAVLLPTLLLLVSSSQFLKRNSRGLTKWLSV